MAAVAQNERESCPQQVLLTRNLRRSTSVLRGGFRPDWAPIEELQFGVISVMGEELGRVSFLEFRLDRAVASTPWGKAVIEVDSDRIIKFDGVETARVRSSLFGMIRVFTCLPDLVLRLKASPARDNMRCTTDFGTIRLVYEGVSSPKRLMEPVSRVEWREEWERLRQATREDRELPDDREDWTNRTLESRFVKVYRASVPVLIPHRFEVFRSFVFYSCWHVLSNETNYGVLP